MTALKAMKAWWGSRRAAFAMWLRGDDGRMWGVITEPSMFRIAESRLEGPFRKREARAFARRFVAANPHGECSVFNLDVGASWPPRTNWGTWARPQGNQPRLPS